ncbi:hypothetical protein HPP92_007318 [Vanilla planifolia]|uniref:Uncharacterized protein n=1 Tax=Vanilla planifolia TaxID=51239 RepID=A0A835RMJ9_VANPL|nr:hypothetical protein HPP92_007523 [Vanilla planifolia]KAG0490455.1 hypothetical protein HPP92_007318 [Vanilla planifolia]
MICQEACYRRSIRFSKQLTGSKLLHCLPWSVLIKQFSGNPERQAGHSHYQPREPKMISKADLPSGCAVSFQQTFSD